MKVNPPDTPTRGKGELFETALDPFQSSYLSSTERKREAHNSTDHPDLDKIYEVRYIERSE
jgi:hypothetical protein